MRWAFFIDANLEPKVAEILRSEGYRAEFSDYTLGPDADDEADILPYAKQEELIIVTADVKNFAPLDDSHHEGVFLLNNQRESAYAVAQAIIHLIEQVESPDNLKNKTLALDPWIRG